ncbi:hypothetical protein HPP92_015743 [Vanilla planifolia]|uniref:Uncharacterized protein n=1 Tax=Vanilla planifolia TaxID=51239 RepID=A0A835QIH0_VANPL|nr:hypothetical protein HPP92_015743 [Vanilla planifolia]
MEILSGVKSSSETTVVNQKIDEVKVLGLIANNDSRHTEVVKVVDKCAVDRSQDSDSWKELSNISDDNKEEASCSLSSEIKNERTEDNTLTTGLCNLSEVRVGDDGTTGDEPEQFSGPVAEIVLENTKGLSQLEIKNILTLLPQKLKEPRSKTKEHTAIRVTIGDFKPFQFLGLFK